VIGCGFLDLKLGVFYQSGAERTIAFPTDVDVERTIAFPTENEKKGAEAPFFIL